MELLQIKKPKWAPSCLMVMQGDTVIRTEHKRNLDKVWAQVLRANILIVADNERRHWKEKQNMLAQKALAVCERLGKSKERLTRKTKGRLIRNGLGEALNVVVQ